MAITKACAFHTYSSVLSTVPYPTASYRAQYQTRAGSILQDEAVIRYCAPCFLAPWSLPNSHECENGLASQVLRPCVYSITALLQGVINEDPLTTRNNMQRRTRERLSWALYLRGSRSWSRCFTGAGAIAPCVLSQNEDLKRPGDPEKGRVGLPFEFLGILGCSLEATLLTTSYELLTVRTSPCERRLGRSTPTT